MVEKVLAGVPAKVVTCLAGAWARPPEDCGSIPGYYNLVAAMADPKHPEREELLNWLGEPFYPEAFNLETVNFLLGRIKL